MSARSPFAMPPRGLVPAALTLALLASGCSDDASRPGAVSAGSQDAALARAQQALKADELLATEQLVNDLTGGFAKGIAGQSAGLATELGGALPTQADAQGAASLGARLASASAQTQQACSQVAQLQVAAAKDAAPARDPQPGDLLYHAISHNLDGSISEISVYQDAPAPVVRIELVTTWPATHPLLRSAQETVALDRGADLPSSADDVWLSYRGELTFAGGQRLIRAVDERNSGGLRSGDRVSVVSTWLPRPGHPRLIDVVTTLEVDVHELADPSDDRFVRADRLTRFTGTAHGGGSPRVEESLVPSSPVAEGQTPCGGHLSRHIVFAQESALQSWLDTADWTCGGGGELSRRIEYADATVAALTLQESSPGVYDLSATERDGTTTSGSFDRGAGTFSLDTRYAQGQDPVRRQIGGRTLAEGSGFELDSNVTWADAFVEHDHLMVQPDAGGRLLTGTHDGRDGHVAVSLRTNADDTDLLGHVENDRGAVLDFHVEVLADGGRLLDFTAVDALRTVRGHLEVDAAGCGHGTLEITEGGNRAEIDVDFCHGEPVAQQ
jgi:hypothetical protein